MVLDALFTSSDQTADSNPGVISRAEAKALGLKRFFTGEPCSEGHVVERYVSIGRCVTCHFAGVRRWERELLDGKRTVEPLHPSSSALIGGRKRVFRGATMLERLEFWSQPEPNSGCWLWLGGVNWDGYAQGWDGKRRSRIARSAFEALVGPIPPGMNVLHRCDTPACVNPGHFFLGNQADNAADMVAKGRSPDRSGERNGRTKLTANDIAAIRADTRARAAIAEAFKISMTQLFRIRRGESWSCLPR